MAFQTKTLKESIVEQLTVDGENGTARKLEIMANLTNGRQSDIVMSAYVDRTVWGSNYKDGLCQTLLRLSISTDGRGRSDLTEIGRSVQQNDYPRKELPDMGNDGNLHI